MSFIADWINTEEALVCLQNELKCKLCKSVAKNPVKFGMCGDFFCRGCVDPGSCICPLCGVASRASEVSPDKTVKDLVTGWEMIAAIVNPIRFGIATAEEDTMAKTNASLSSSVKSKRGRLGTTLKASTAHNKMPEKPAAKKVSTDNSKEPDKPEIKCKQSRASTEGKKSRSKKDSESSAAASNKLDQNDQLSDDQPKKKETMKKPLPVSKKRSNSKEGRASKKGPNTNQATENLDDILGTPKPSETPKIKTPKCHTPVKTLVKRNFKGETPLHVACIKGNVTTLKSLLAAGANPNTKDNAGWTPLHEAVSKGFAEVVELLLDAGALVDVPGVDNMTPLHEAVASGRTAIVRMLVARGANSRARTSAGKTPWDFAVTPEVKEALETTVLSQNSANIRDPIMNLSDKETVVCCVGLDKQSKKDFIGLSAKLSLRVVANFSQDVSHLIVATDKNNVCPPSIDVFSAILCGCWIVNRDWLSIGVESNETVEPSLFEIRGITDYVSDGPRRGRLNAWKQLPGLFNGCHFYLLNNAQMKIGDCSITRKDFITLIKYGGGVLLSREPRPEDIPEKERTVPYHTTQKSDLEHTSHYIIYGEAKAPALKYNMVHIKTLSAEWLVGCIANFKLLDP